MTIEICKIIAKPVAFHNRHVTIEGVVRTVCPVPFPHFTVEDKTATLICKSMNGLPGVGAHIEVSGQFVIDVPTNCSIPVPRLNETNRDYIGHSQACGYIGCEFAETVPFAA